MKTGIYEHYKGNRYEVIDTVRDSESEELMVLYRALYGDENLWVRAYTMFFEEVEVGGKSVPRFKFIGAKN
ncbi:MAG: hypothetical protein QG617_1613 [Campylobacterota bacterium]|jgi:hypothetical protein|nr:hypothetical protein [Campylobacterota bacterium]